MVSSRASAIAPRSLSRVDAEGGDPFFFFFSGEGFDSDSDDDGDLAVAALHLPGLDFATRHLSFLGTQEHRAALEQTIAVVAGLLVGVVPDQLPNRRRSSGVGEGARGNDGNSGWLSALSDPSYIAFTLADFGRGLLSVFRGTASAHSILAEGGGQFARHRL
mmetsp:Transcript_15331/g.33138  ORF Transcript_15331/g.33138 Transcript_15331/m.33138 type:complete len:162 (+) Transcript_15331:213-698(+)|eukprot:CAMPEP_0206457378 /NCGR_PEP_ID=MMETSP0324_2-20121206/22925_1 /ASSEMBLY_ACC=CAM_ASM_000836 /TAXON_ID=2866 /ORGANISM="Crypthecodinium cohnii, Strain Seligo" /LENGTH=161 /DNA_ID=CAMNT_0053928487 /DNA_START=185 /DNA_END=670 /DNA_ORIENTATION=-